MSGSFKAAVNGTWQRWRFQWSADDALVFRWYYRFFYRPKAGSIQSFLDAYSKQTKNFRVIQVGANDGITHDLIHKFIKRDQWQGVLLEPQLAVFARLQQLYHKNRQITPLRAAIGEQDGEASLYKIAFSQARWATGLASFNKEVILQAFASGYVENKALAEGVDIPAAETDRITAESIPVISPATLIEQYKLDHFHLLQIDTEGFDLEVIRLFAAQTTLPDAVIFENAHLDDEQRETARKILDEIGLQCRDFGKDTLAFRPVLQPLVPGA